MNVEPQSDPLLDDARKLVPAAKLYAISVRESLGAKFPSSLSVGFEQWQWVFTIASVFLAASRLANLEVGEKRESAVMSIVCRDLNEWKPDGLAGFDDCKGLFESEYDSLAASGYEARFLATDSLGIWIVWNLFGHRPTSDEECQMVRAAGLLEIKTFFDWWSVQRG